VSLCGKARQGAHTLGLIDIDNELTDLGERVVEYLTADATIDQRLAEIGDLKRSQQRYCNIAPEEHIVAMEHTLSNYKPSKQIFTLLGETGPVTLDELLEASYQRENDVASHLLAKPDHWEYSEPAPISADAYHSSMTFQLKSICYHSGLLTTRGKHSDGLCPIDDIWELENYPEATHLV